MSASLSLLKGATKSAVEEEIKKIEPETSEEDVVVDVDELDSPQLDALVEENEIDTPDEWKGWDAGNKRAWLKSQFEDSVAGEEAEDAPAQAGETPAEDPSLSVKSETPVIEEAPAQAVAKPAKTKKAPKSKSTEVATSDVKNGELIEADVLADLVNEIENLKKNDAIVMITALSEQTELTMFRLGGVLSLIQAQAWYEPYASFRDFVEKEHGIDYRKATYWVAIYNGLSEAQVPWSKVQGLGWTKLKEIARVINKENQDQWIEIAKNSNTLTLIDTVKKALQKDKAKAIEGPEGSSTTVTTKTFKVHDDQKATIETAIEKAKEQSGTTVDTVALEFICIDFLGGQTLEQKLKAMGMEAAFAILEKAFPNVDITVDVKEDAA